MNIFKTKQNTPSSRAQSRDELVSITSGGFMSDHSFSVQINVLLPYKTKDGRLVNRKQYGLQLDFDLLEEQDFNASVKGSIKQITDCLINGFNQNEELKMELKNFTLPVPDYDDFKDEELTDN